MTRTQKFVAQLPGLRLAIGIAIVATAIGHFVPLVGGRLTSAASAPTAASTPGELITAVPELAPAAVARVNVFRFVPWFLIGFTSLGLQSATGLN